MKIYQLFFLFIIFSNDSFAQRTYYGYQERESTYDKEKQKLKAVVLTLSQDDRTIQINLLGELVSYRAALGDEIKRDYSNKIEKIGSIELSYDYEKRVTKFGNSEVKYSYGKMTEIGKYEVIYDYSGEFKGTKEKYNPYRNW